MNKQQRKLGLFLGGFVLAVSGCPSSTKPDSEDAAAPTTAHFSFFVTSLRALQELSGSQLGFGGDLRFGETGPGAGLRGADKICSTIAERSMPGAGQKTWRAFLSAVADENGKQVDAIDRIGNGPWYDRIGRVFSMTRQEALSERPGGADTAIQNDFPNEDGVPNHRPDVSQSAVDNHDMLTGTNTQGRLYGATATCKDWTANLGDKASEGMPRVGHSWPRGGFGGDPRPDGGGMMRPDGGMMRPDGGMFPPFGDGGMFPPFGDGGMFPPGGDIDGSGNNWMSALTESGCAPGVNLIEMGGPMASSNTVGSGGGYGGFYCFALTP